MKKTTAKPSTSQPVDPNPIILFLWKQKHSGVSNCFTEWAPSLTSDRFHLRFDPAQGALAGLEIRRDRNVETNEVEFQLVQERKTTNKHLVNHHITLVAAGTAADGETFLLLRNLWRAIKPQKQYTEFGNPSPEYLLSLLQEVSRVDIQKARGL